MTSALLPADLALAYLRLLSTDIRDAVIATAAGEPLAGNPALLAPASGDGTRHSASDAHHTVVVETGPHVLPSVLELDLRSILGDLRTR